MTDLANAAQQALRRGGGGGPIGEREAALVVPIARALYPHPGLGDGPYERVADAVLATAAAVPAVGLVLDRGLADLAVALEGRADLESVTAELAAIQEGELFRTLRPLVARHLYDDPEVRAHIGYPGPSSDLGGYLHRGFDDLDWLPDPPVEEPDEPLVELGPLPYPVATADRRAP
ncbi:hypothetical protein [Pseudonocardia cypriaca]|uniref:Gluconate 2-dehydrogenase subunit 3-like protein n=1 Tax=Pseudonocardia cypriaca TaxID=882449 RepID=A0A543FT51_9PSEU|nr:hypothetical protein [Pseudonocardia cypriaca]TQM37006.1 hypothetical protein FB388_4203 [Pseudonocardia cypriaca]